jgi:MFS family permease
MSASGPGLPQRDWNFTAVYSLGFLYVISVFNYLDRSLLGLALPAIKVEMQASDTVLGLVSGLAFVLFYAILGIPIAWAADRWNRRNIIAAGFAFWSLMTALTGWVGTIWQLAIARFLMGAGEACCLPPSNSIIADLFRKARRPLVLSIFGTANSVALIVFFPIAGWIAHHYGWRMMFIAAGAPGIVLAVFFVLTVKEPRRGASEDKPVRPASDGWRAMARFLAGSRTYVLLLAGATLMGANIFAAAAWTPSFLNRVHDMTLAQVAASIGPVRGILGAAGILVGGIVIDRLLRGNPRWRVRLPALACILLGPAEALFLLGEPYWAWFLGFALTSFLTLLHQGPIYAVAMDVVRLGMRAMAIALLIFCASLLGQVCGPFMVGVLTDALQPTLGDSAIRYSLLIVAVTPVLAGLCFWAAASSYADDMERATVSDNGGHPGSAAEGGAGS